MADERTESPTLEEQVTETAEPTSTDTEREELLSKLESLQVRDAQQLDNMAMASYQAGKMAEELGAVRRELSALKQQRVTPQTPYEDYPEGQAVNLGAEIKKGIYEVVNEMGQQQRQAQEYHQQMLAKVRSDKRYPMISNEFEQAVRDPATWQRLQMGETYADIYAETLIGKFEGLLGESHQVLKSMGSKPSQMTPPHMEAGNTVSTPGVSPSEDRADQLRRLEEEHRAGRVSDRDFVLRKIELETDIDDPIFRP